MIKFVTMTPKMLRAALLAAALAAGSVSSAQAHHSFNMFDLGKAVTVTGTIKDYQFKMPHVWFYMLLPTGTNGAAEEWGFECHSPNLVARKGWNINTLKPGDKLTVIMHPMKDGSKAGSVVNVVLANGKTLWNAESLTQP
jgi:hypothetical protein